MNIIKHIIMACGCYDEEKQEWLNKCGTDECPHFLGKFGTNGCAIDSFSDKEDKEKTKD